MKRCSACRVEKSLESFARNRSRKDGLHPTCRVCKKEQNARYYKANPEKFKVRRRQNYYANFEKEMARNARYVAENRHKVRARRAKYWLSEAGIAAGLRSNHGLNHEQSRQWAQVLASDDTRCSICGVPTWKLRKMLTWKQGSYRLNRRLTLDHVNPGQSDGNYRPLCFSCNSVRGANELSDAEVLEIMRRWYLRIYTLKNCWWLNTRVEDGMCVGGHAELPGRAKKLARLKEAE